jgi:1-acyl-sn-glycerol-3-phosphate acyltransferase
VQPIALRFSDARTPISAAVEFVGATTLVESLWRVACADALVVHVSLLPARPSADADRRVLAQALHGDIAARISTHSG